MKTKSFVYTVPLIIAVVMMVVFAAGLALQAQTTPAVEKIKGEIVRVHHQCGAFTIKVEGKNMDLMAEPKMVKEIKAGDMVEVEKTGNTVKSITKVAAPGTK